MKVTMNHSLLMNIFKSINNIRQCKYFINPIVNCIIFIYPNIKTSTFCVFKYYNKFLRIWILRYSINFKNVFTFAVKIYFNLLRKKIIQNWLEPQSELA